MLKKTQAVKQTMTEFQKPLTSVAALQNKLGLRLPTPVHRLSVNWGKASNVQISMKRDDLMHAIISGNKWRKLQGTLLNALESNTQHIISFGGGHSNHLHALAYCCHILKIQLTAIVRGDYSEHITPTLQDITRWGANLRYVNKIEYRKRHDQQYLRELQQSVLSPAPALIVPEGGSNNLALAGVASLLSELQHDYDYICCPVGSGGTLAGLALGLANQCQSSTKLLGIAMLKGETHLEDMVQRLLPDKVAVPEIIHQFHAGGFAKKPHWLVAF